jgi:hypothetical protein
MSVSSCAVTTSLTLTRSGVDIADVWNSNHLVTSDAGDMLSLAQTLRFTLVRLQNGH